MATAEHAGDLGRRISSFARSGDCRRRRSRTGLESSLSGYVRDSPSCRAWGMTSVAVGAKSTASTRVSALICAGEFRLQSNTGGVLGTLPIFTIYLPPTNWLSSVPRCLCRIVLIICCLFDILKLLISGTFPIDRFWGGERARRV